MYASIDIETTGLNRYKEEITFIGLELHKDLDSPALKVYIFDWSVPKEQERFKKIAQKLKEKHVKCVWQNGKFDTLFIKVKTGIHLPIHEDIMLMGTAYDLAAEHGLKKMAQIYLGVEDWDIKTKEKTSSSQRFKNILFRVFAAVYSSISCGISYPIAANLLHTEASAEG